MTHLAKPDRVSGNRVVGNGDAIPVALPTSANGWPLRPFQIVSLLEVLRNYAEQFLLIGKVFGSGPARVQGWNEATRRSAMADEAKTSTQTVLDLVKTACENVQISDAVLKGIKWAKEQIAKDGVTYEEYGRVMEELDRRIKDELSTIRLFHVQSNAVQYYPAESSEYKKPLLSPQAKKKFAKSIEDADEAGKCFALGRYTACVFHLMRVMERGVQRLGKKLRVPIPVEEKDWGVISSSINGALKRLPNSTVSEKRIHARYAKAAVYLDNVREAWRNPTMHPKETYTEEEAEDCFRFVKQYTEHLVKIL